MLLPEEEARMQEQSAMPDSSLGRERIGAARERLVLQRQFGVS